MESGPTIISLSFIFTGLGTGVGAEFIPISTGGEELVTTPEPTAMLLLGSGLLGLAGFWKRFKK
jgi:hypothetical protein